MTYVNAKDLSDEQNEVVDQVRTIIREKQVPVEDLGNLRPAQVVAKVEAALGRPFTMHLHTQSWRYFKARPAGDAIDKTATRADFCRWNPAFEQYVYTAAWVGLLIRKLSDDDMYESVAAFGSGSTSEA